MEIIVSDEIKNICPGFVGACIEASVSNGAYSETLWNEILDFCKECRSNLTVGRLKEIPSIAATRAVYRLCGKDPSRYRPSAEALVRRVLKGGRLYQVNNIVDLTNLASMVYGYSIGAFDADRFVGGKLVLGIGKHDEPYEGIGRGMVNIEGLPVYRDSEGGVGTPTTDNERTKVEVATKRLAVLINGYDGSEQGVTGTAEYIISLLSKYCSSEEATYHIYR